MIKEIFEFNRMLGSHPKGVPQMEFKHAMFNVKAIREEALELEVQHLTNGGNSAIEWADAQCEEARWQTVRSVDAVIDAAYFAVGAMSRAGLTEEQAIDCFLAVHEANMRKKRGVVASRGDMGVADAAKPADFVPPDEKIYEILFGSKPSWPNGVKPQMPTVDPKKPNLPTGDPRGD